MAFSGARIEAYSFADTSARWKSTHTLGVTIGGATTVQHTSPMRLEDQLADWQAKLDAAKPAGAPWALSYDSTTRRVTIASAGANFALSFPGRTARWLGMTGVYAGANTYTGNVAPAAVVQCAAVDSEIAQAHERADLREYRHGRAIATCWGKLDLFKVTAWVRRDNYPWQAATAASETVDEALRSGWIAAGRVRVVQSEPSEGSEYTAVRISGYIDGYVASCNATLETQTDLLVRLELTIVRPYVATGVDDPAGLWGACKYGWNPTYWLTIGGVPVAWSERTTGLTAPAAFPAEVGGALVIDDSAAVGSIIDRNRGLGAGLSLSFKLLDNATLAGYLRKPAHATYLTADMTATGAGAIHVASTTGFDANGAIYIGGERIAHTGKTGTTFTGITRGSAGSRKAIHKKDSGAQIVTDGLRWWQGRDVVLYACATDPAGYCTGTAMADDSYEVWRGRLTAAPLRAPDGWTFAADALDRLLEKPLASKISGKVKGFAATVTVEKAWNCSLMIDGLDAAFTSVWAAGPYNFMLVPFEGAGYTEGQIISATQARAAIADAWTAAVTALGAGADLGGLYYAPTNVQGAFTPRPIIKTNAALAYVKVWSSDWGGSTIQFDAGFGAFPLTQTWGPNANENVGIYVGWNSGPNPLKASFEPASQSLAVEVADGDPADVPASGYIRITRDKQAQVCKYSGATVDGTSVYLGKIAPQGNTWDPNGKIADFAGADVQIWFSDGPAALATLMLHSLESNGGATGGTYDTLAQGQGYGLTAVDEAAFSAQSAELDLTATVSAAGSSFADLFSGALAMARKAVVQRSGAGTTRAVALACVDTAPDGSDYADTLTDWHLLHLEDDPVEGIERLDPPNSIKCQRIAAAKKDGEDEAVEFRDVSSIAEKGENAANWPIPADTLDAVRQFGETKAKSHFFAEQDAQAVTFRVPPWFEAQPGDLIWCNGLTHPSLWDYAAMAMGYTGRARVTGRALRLKDLTVELTAVLQGQFTANGLCPAAAAKSWDAAGAPSWIKVDLKYLPHFTAALAEAGGPVPVLHYFPGDTEGTGQRYTISAAVENGGDCKLTIAAQVGVFNLSLAKQSTLTLPPLGAFSATAYQDQFAHVDDGSRWL